MEGVCLKPVKQPHVVASSRVNILRGMDVYVNQARHQTDCGVRCVVSDVCVVYEWGV